MLVFVAVLGLPLVALAQPTTDDSKATEVSELVVRARKATEVSGVTVNSHCGIPAAGRQWPSAWFDAPSDSRNKRTEESAGTRAFILKLMADIRNGAPDYARYGDQLDREMHAKFGLTRLWIVCRGAFKDIRFLHVSQAGYDDFEVDFSTGALEWEIKPLNVDQVAEQTAIRFYYPQPVTRQFEDLLKSLEWGQPNYFALTKDCAAKLEAQWPQLQAAIKIWPGPPSIFFLRRGDDGSYTYLVTYRQFRALWEVGPLDRAGKITSLKYDAGPN